MIRPPCGRLSSSSSTASRPAPAATPRRPPAPGSGSFSLRPGPPVSSAARVSAAASGPLSSVRARRAQVTAEHHRAEQRDQPPRRAPVLAGDRHQQQALPGRAERLGATGSRLATAPPKPGTAASSVVNRPTRRTHQWVRACTSIAPRRRCPAPRRGQPRVEHLSRSPRSTPAALVRARTRGPAARTGRPRAAPSSTGRVARTNGRSTAATSRVRDRPAVPGRRFGVWSPPSSLRTSLLLVLLPRRVAHQDPAQRHSPAPSPPNSSSSDCQVTGSSTSPPGPATPSTPTVSTHASSGAAATRAGVELARAAAPARAARDRHQRAQRRRDAADVERGERQPERAQQDPVQDEQARAAAVGSSGTSGTRRGLPGRSPDDPREQVAGTGAGSRRHTYSSTSSSGCATPLLIATAAAAPAPTRARSGWRARASRRAGRPAARLTSSADVDRPVRHAGQLVGRRQPERQARGRASSASPASSVGAADHRRAEPRDLRHPGHRGDRDLVRADVVGMAVPAVRARR